MLACDWWRAFWVNNGVLLVRRRNNTSARWTGIDPWLELVALRPEHVGAKVLCGVLQLALGQTKEARATLERAIESLPDDLRTAIILRELDGMSYEEIAQTMDCPVGTVRSRIFRARDAIAKKVGALVR